MMFMGHKGFFHTMTHGGRALVYVFKKVPLLCFGNLLLSVLMGFTPALSIWAIQLLVNTMSQLAVTYTQVGHQGALSYQLVWRALFVVKTPLVVLCIYAGIQMLIFVIKTAYGYLQNKQNLVLDYAVGMDVLEKCVALELQDFENSEIYDTIARADGEGRQKVMATYGNVLSLINQMTAVISVSILMTALMVKLNVFIFIFIFISPLLSTYVQTQIGYKNYKMRMARMGDVRKTGYISYLLTNDIACKEIKVYETGAYLKGIYSTIKLKIQGQDLHMFRLKSGWDLGLNLLEEVLSIVVIGHIMILTAMGQLLIGSAVACVDSLSTIQSSVGSFLRILAALYNDALYVEQYFKLMDLETPIQSGVAIERISHIEFKQVSYRYPGNEAYTLKDFNLSLSSGEKVAILGENGAGKTTFIKLLCGLYSDYEGEILFDGVELRRLNKTLLRRKMGIIFQDFNRYEMTLRENIAFGELSYLKNDSRLNDVLEKIHLRSKIENYLLGLETQMGHWFGGEELSKGQWQRIALGRAFLRDADVYVLDEPTASLDPLAERQIFELMAGQNEDKLCVFVTHRMENLKLINPRVVVLGEAQMPEVDASGHQSQSIGEFVAVL